MNRHFFTVYPDFSSELAETADLLVEKCNDYNCSYEEGWFHYLCSQEHPRVSFREVMDYLCNSSLKKAN